MDYEKKYKEALERMRYVVIDPKNENMLQAIKETVFPELKESEDEKIRKSIYNYIDVTLDDNESAEKEKWLAWLEKQGKHKPVDINASLINKMVNDYKNTDEYVDGDYKGKPINCMVRAYRQGIKDILSISKENSIKSAWSEEDESWFKELELMALSFSNDVSYLKKFFDWLKFLKDRVQPKQKWSEEDEVKINRIVACLENLNVADNDILLKDIDWLKSLKQRIGG